MGRIASRSRFIVIAVVAVAASVVVNGPAVASSTTCASYTDFSSTAGLTLLGDASTNANDLQLTPDLVGETGAAYTTAQVPVVKGFKSTFSFQVTHSAQAADGFAFVINASATVIPATPGYDPGGSGLGYNGLLNSVAIEFDTFQSTDDPNDNHISVHPSGFGIAGDPIDSDDTVGSVASTGTSSLHGVTMSDGNVHNVTISYKPKTSTRKPTLAVVLDTKTVLTTHKVNLKKALDLPGGTAWMGFSGTTGGLSEANLIKSWTASCKAV